MFWLAIVVAAVGAVWVLARIRRAIRERERESEARAAQLLAGLVGAAAPPAPAAAAPPPAHAAPGNDLAVQKLLFEAARKAGEAGEPALAIQLYGRLLARYPATAFAGEVRAAAEMLKKKLVKN